MFTQTRYICLFSFCLVLVCFKRTILIFLKIKTSAEETEVLLQIVDVDRGETKESEVYHCVARPGLVCVII